MLLRTVAEKSLDAAPTLGITGCCYALQQRKSRCNVGSQFSAIKTEIEIGVIKRENRRLDSRVEKE